MTYIVISLQYWDSVPGLVQGEVATAGKKLALWNYYRAQAFRRTFRDILQCWPMTGDFVDVIEELGPVYIKTSNGTTWTVYCLDMSRISLTVPQLVSEQDQITLAGVPFDSFISTDPVADLISRGYTAQVQ